MSQSIIDSLPHTDKSQELKRKINVVKNVLRLNLKPKKEAKKTAEEPS